MKIYKRFLASFVFTFLVINSSFCQEVNWPSRIRVGFFYDRAENSYHIFEETNYGSYAVVKPHSAVNWGITGSYLVNTNLTIQTGAGLGDYGYDMEYSGASYPKGLYNCKVSYLDVPLQVLYILNPQNKIQLITSAGFCFGFFLYKNFPYYSTGHVQINNKYFDDFDQYAKALYGLTLGGGIRYNSSKRVSLTCQATGKKVINKNTYAYDSWDNEWTHFSSVGFKITLEYNLR